jgi:hypothetical protein
MATIARLQNSEARLEPAGLLCIRYKGIYEAFLPNQPHYRIDPVTREMNNFDKWIRITYAECVDFGVPRIMGM